MFSRGGHYSPMRTVTPAWRPVLHAQAHITARVRNREVEATSGKPLQSHLEHSAATDGEKIVKKKINCGNLVKTNLGSFRYSFDRKTIRQRENKWLIKSLCLVSAIFPLSKDWQHCCGVSEAHKVCSLAAEQEVNKSKPTIYLPLGMMQYVSSVSKPHVWAGTNVSKAESKIRNLS